MGQEVVSEY